MKRLLVFCLSVIFFISATNLKAQEEKKYKFEPVISLEHTPVKNQHRSGTCWAFSGLSFLESELLRVNKKQYDLSEMFIVRHTYPSKAEKYVRMHGNLNFAAGGSFEDIFYVWKNFGLVPEEAYKGLEYGESLHNHTELDKVSKAFVEAVQKSAEEATPTTAWKTAYNALMDSYLGKYPEKFTVDGKEFTPKTYAESLQIKVEDYISITSFTHHPFYEKFQIEIPDNWVGGYSYNVPMEELLEIAHHSLKNGYTIAWASDVSERGFAYRKGIAVAPITETAQMSNSDQARWIGLSDRERYERIFSFNEIVPEKTITQELRQEEFDNYKTTDDHGMHIVGTAKNSDGRIFFTVKNSWGTESNEFGGYFYCSENFFLYKTISIVIHKDALPKHIAKKLGVK